MSTLLQRLRLVVHLVGARTGCREDDDDRPAEKHDMTRR